MSELSPGTKGATDDVAETKKVQAGEEFVVLLSQEEEQLLLEALSSNHRFKEN